MKVIAKQIDNRDKSGFVKVVPEIDEDIWQLYQLVVPGDQVESSTYRRVTKEASSLAVKNDSERIRVNLVVSVEQVNVDLSVNILHLHGRICRENKYAKMGSFHTIDVDLQHPVTIWKQEWNFISLSILQELSSATNKAEIVAIIFQPGVAHLCFITESTTTIKQKIELSLPKKHSRDKAILQFYHRIYQAFCKWVDINRIRVVILASPGFYKEQLFEYILSHSSQNNEILGNRDKFVLAHSSSGYLNGLSEVLSNPQWKSRFSDLKYFQENSKLNEFLDMLRKCPDKAYYGYDYINTLSHISKSINTLLISSSLFRSTDISERKKYDDLVERVKQTGARVYVFSSSHDSSSRLEQMTGVAAILNYPITEEELVNK